MKLFLDTINISDIEYYSKILPLQGITSNPTIVKKEGRIEFFSHMKEIKKIIPNLEIHVQVIGTSRKRIIEDAEVIVKNLGVETYIKIPVTLEGLAAIKILKEKNYKITATAIYTEFQGYLAVAANVDYLAPYYNRMEDLGVNSKEIISNLANHIHSVKSDSKILCASFKNITQVNESIQAGAQATTVNVDIVSNLLSSSVIDKAVKDFQNDWEDVFEVTNLSSL
ncbi:fructose-6-phosphate aldolase [Enterococcus olivae]